MKRFGLMLGILLMMGAGMVNAQGKFEQDVIKTEAGDLTITFIGHGTLMFTFGGKAIHVDPVGQYADYGKFPKADLILITHGHRDHLDPKAVAMLRQPSTEIVLTQAAAGLVAGGLVMANGEVKTVAGLTIEAVPAYNLVHKRENGEPFHPKGAGQRLYHHLRGQKGLCGRGHREHPGDEGPQGHRHRFFAHESPLHHDPGDGGRRGPGFQTQDPLSLSFRPDGYRQAGGPAERPPGDRGAASPDGVKEEWALPLVDMRRSSRQKAGNIQVLLTE